MENSLIGVTGNLFSRNREFESRREIASGNSKVAISCPGSANFIANQQPCANGFSAASGDGLWSPMQHHSMPSFETPTHRESRSTHGSLASHLFAKLEML